MTEATLYFRDADSNAADSGALLSASCFLGVHLTGAGTCQFDFKTGDNTAKVTSIESVTFTGAFKDLCRAIAGALNSNTMTVVGDHTNGVFLSYPGGAVTAIGNVDDKS
jgi:hypothetical protein|tara:strand:+ start:60 stop:386 length:327 start_codon:yes stop_codon:yes gene_type:complete